MRNPTNHTRPPVTDPRAWWRFLCWITGTRIALCGDLPANRTAARRQLAEWAAAGITHIVDVRGEHSDEEFVRREAPGLTYVWLPTHDNGGAQDPRWFEHGVAGILAILDDPDARVVVHCHMGVNRAPSLAFAALLGLGFDPIAALDAIRTARPIAGILYAADAVEWWADRDGLMPADIARDLVEAWHDANPVDLRWIISRIRKAEVSDFDGLPEVA